MQEILPPKFEHVLLLRLSHVQQTLYDLNITSNHGNSGGAPSGVESVLPTAGGLVNVLPPTAVSSSIGPLKAFAVSTKVIMIIMIIIVIIIIILNPMHYIICNHCTRATIVTFFLDMESS